MNSAEGVKRIRNFDVITEESYTYEKYVKIDWNEKKYQI